MSTSVDEEEEMVSVEEEVEAMTLKSLEGCYFVLSSERF